MRALLAALLIILAGCTAELELKPQLQATTCTDLQGTLCHLRCDGTIANASDTQYCCLGVCVADSPTRHPYLFRVEGPGNGYLFGTIHISDERIVTLPAIVWTAIQESKVLYTEVGDVSNAGSGIERADVPLIDAIPSPLYDRLDRYLAARGYSILLFDMAQPWEAAVFIELLDILEDNERLQLDTYLARLALGAGNRVGALEHPQEQVSIFADLSMDDQVRILNETLSAYESYSDDNYQLMVRYLEGQDRFAERQQTNERESIRVFNRALIEDRNLRMTGRMDEYMKRDTETLFFAIGAGHLYGAEGVIELLRAKGYTVTRVNFSPSEQCDEPLIKRNGYCYLPYSEDLLGQTLQQPIEFGEGNIGIIRDGECTYGQDAEEEYTGDVCIRTLVYGLRETPFGDIGYNIDVYVRQKGDFTQDATVTQYRNLLGEGARLAPPADGWVLATARFPVNDLVHGYYSVEIIVKDTYSGASESRVLAFKVI